MLIYRDQRKLLKLTILGGLFFGVCILVFLGELHKGTIPAPKVFLLWLAAGFTVIAWLLNIFLLFDRRPALDIRHDGLIANNISHDLIPWSGITAVGIRKIKFSPMLELQISPQTLRTIRLSRRSLFTGPLNKILGFQHFYIPTTTLGYSAEYIRDALQARMAGISADDEVARQQ